MSRESGWYWVKINEDSEWANFRYCKMDGWCGFLEDSHFHKINPTRILTPDEQEEKELNEALQSKADMAYQEYLDDC